MHEIQDNSRAPLVEERDKENAWIVISSAALVKRPTSSQLIVGYLSLKNPLSNEGSTLPNARAS